MTDYQPRALLSVSDKQGILEFAESLIGQGWKLLSTGGTAELLRRHNLQVTEVSEQTGFPEIMGGRVKTLHPAIHGGILARRGIDDAVLKEHNIDPIDLVVVNLYPFESAVADPACSFENAIENIDIGGPAMIRASAKNHASVTVVTDPADYERVLDTLASGDSDQLSALRYDLGIRAFEHTARYDGMIANYFGARITEPHDEPALFPRTLNVQLEKAEDLRYGENPHQNAAFYVASDASAGTVAASRQLQGKALSYNNIADTDTALECVKQFDSPGCVIVKHANPCGVGESTSGQLIDAYELAYQTDPTSAFGGIIAFNRPLDETTASAIVERQFSEVIVAPGFSEGALTALGARENVRVLDCGKLAQTTSGIQYSHVSGGLLAQQSDTALVTPDELRVVTEKAPDQQQINDLMFAWKVAKFVKSNAIVFARSGQTIGVGAGQMSRVYSSRIAAIKASDENLAVAGAVMASDAFFPFRDGIDTAAEYGIAAVIQPGGSKNDQDVIDAANEHGMAMVFSGMRHFRH